MSTTREAMAEIAASLDGGNTNESEAAGDSGVTENTQGLAGSESEAAPSVESGADAPKSAPKTETPSSSRARAPDGKFAKTKEVKPQETKASETTPPAPSTTTGSPPPAGGDSSQTPVPVTEAVKAPQSWTPTARAAFAKAPIEVQKEVQKREQEIARALQESAPDRRFRQEYAQALSPYEPILRQYGQNPIQGLQNVAQTLALFHTGSPNQVAAALGQLVKQHGTGRFGVGFVEQLAQAIDGTPPPQNGQTQASFDPQQLVAQAKQQVFAELQQQQAQAQDQQNLRAVQKFYEKPEVSEFIGDVWQDVAAIIKAAKARGGDISLEDAYNRAIWANPETRAIVQQRQQEEAARASQQAAQQKRAAAVSVKSSPAGPSPGKARTTLDVMREVAAAKGH